MVWFDQRREAYATVFCLEYSPCGKFLASGDSCGRLTLHKLTSLLDSKPESDTLLPWFQFEADCGPIYCLASTATFLICGGDDGMLRGYKWSDLLKKTKKPAWVINTNVNGKSLDGSAYEVNAMAISEDEERIYSGGGENHIYVWSLENGKLESRISGHSDYIQCLNLAKAGASSSSLLASGSEDGSVRLWDLRTNTCNHVFEPYKQKSCARSEIGKWIGCVLLDQDWLICGGAPSLSMWHLGGSSALVNVMPDEAVEHQVAVVWDDRILSGGSASAVQHWNFSGEHLTNVPTTSRRIYDLKTNHNNPKYKVLAACGSHSKIDLFLNIGYKSYSLKTFS